MANTTNRLKAWLEQYNLRKEMALAGLVITCALAFASPSNAGIPVIDGAKLMQFVVQAQQMVLQIANEVRKIEEWRNRYDQMLAKYEAMTSSRGMGNLHRGGIENDVAQMVTSDMRTFLTQVRAGAVPGVLGSYVANDFAQIPTMQADDWSPIATEAAKSTEGMYTASAFMRNTMASKNLDNLNQVGTRLTGLLDSIDVASGATDDDMKRSIDLKNRILMETALMAIMRAQQAAAKLHGATSKDIVALRVSSEELANLKRALDGEQGLN